MLIHITFVLFLFGEIHSIIFDGVSLDCESDIFSSNRYKDNCIKLGHKFISGYFNALTEDKEYNSCIRMEDFKNCFKNLVNCHPEDESLREWSEVYNIISRACDSDAEAQRKIHCLNLNYKSYLVGRCNAYYKFYRKQKVFSHCMIRSESIHCKYSLIKSACGESTGLLSFIMFRLYENDSRKSLKCTIPLDESHIGFSYSNKCPVEFPHTIEECMNIHIKPKQLTFSKDFDLIASLKSKGIRSACRAFKEYNRCLKTLQKNCAEGIEILRDYVEKLRIYTLKMDYICNKEMQDYAENIHCYGDVLKNESLSKCDPLWKERQQNIPQLSAYQFYCERNTSQAMDSLRNLNEFRTCNEEVFTEKCGATGGRAIGGLIQAAFQDPLYLRYRFKPDCDKVKKFLVAAPIIEKSSINVNSLNEIPESDAPSGGTAYAEPSENINTSHSDTSQLDSRISNFSTSKRVIDIKDNMENDFNRDEHKDSLLLVNNDSEFHSNNQTNNESVTTDSLPYSENETFFSNPNGIPLTNKCDCKLLINLLFYVVIIRFYGLT